jgi:hypothetical protein
LTTGDLRRSNVSVTSDQDIDFNANGNGVLVQLASSDYNGNVDFQTTIDGVTYHNIPYMERTSPSLLHTKEQIRSYDSSPRLYLLRGPLSQVRIACAGRSAGTLTLAYRTVPDVGIGQHHLAYDFYVYSSDDKPSVNIPDGATLYEFGVLPGDNKVYVWQDLGWQLLPTDPILRVQQEVLHELREIVAILKQVVTDPESK